MSQIQVLSVYNLRGMNTPSKEATKSIFFAAFFKKDLL